MTKSVGLVIAGLLGGRHWLATVWARLVLLQSLSYSGAAGWRTLISHLSPSTMIHTAVYPWKDTQKYCGRGILKPVFISMKYAECSQPVWHLKISRFSFWVACDSQGWAGEHWHLVRCRRNWVERARVSTPVLCLPFSLRVRPGTCRLSPTATSGRSTREAAHRTPRSHPNHISETWAEPSEAGRAPRVRPTFSLPTDPPPAHPPAPLSVCGLRIICLSKRKLSKGKRAQSASSDLGPLG